MTQLFTETGESVPVTVIEAAPNRVTAVRTADADGYDAVQLGWDEVAERKLTKAEVGHLAKTDAPPLRHLAEFRDYDGEVEMLPGPIRYAVAPQALKVRMPVESV